VPAFVASAALPHWPSRFSGTRASRFDRRVTILREIQ
jgi:hypothetical protein